MPREKPTDFRYETGPARVPWAAVGEAVNEDDIARIVEFLIPPGKNRRAYRTQLGRIKKEVGKLAKLGTVAAKLSLGSKVAQVEAEARKFLKVKYALFLTNATAGFEIGYKYAGIGPGDEVIAPAITYISSISYPLQVGAKVVFADLNPRTINMDPADVERKITRRTKVIIPVHIGGYPVDMAPIMRLARKHNLTVIEDAAHAYGGTYRGRMTGTIGHFGSFSFHEVKNITSMGEGGILVTNLPIGKDFGPARFVGIDPSRQAAGWVYDVRALRGKSGYFIPGMHNTTEIQAVCLLSQMRRLKRVLAKRRANALYLNRRFREVDGIITPPEGINGTRGTWHLYLFQIDPEKAGGNIQQLKKKLAARGITQIPHYAPLYKFSMLRRLGYDAAAIAKTCPVAEDLFNNRFTHLPPYPLTKEQLEYMADAIIESVKEMQAGK